MAEWRRTLDVNLTGTYLVIRSCLPWMQKEAAGTIVNIASAAGLLPNAPGLTAYAASKGAVVNLGRALAAELAPKIRVNTVCPGLVDTPMGDKHRAKVENYALKRMADPIEIARGNLPIRQRRLVEAWAEIHQPELLADWERLTSGQPALPIEPLR